MKLSEVLTLIGCLVTCMSCSIKEDRDVCPCRLVLDMHEVDTSVVKCVELVVSASGSFVARDTLEVDEFASGYVVDVPREDIAVGVYFGASDNVDDLGGLDIEYGEECPQVYMHSSFVKAEGEMVRENVLMRKNHCIMTIQVESEKEFPFSLEAKGNIDGYEAGGKPSVGEFMYAMHADVSGTCTLTLPRQTDESLVLEVHDETGALKVFALGEYVAASGYDWQEDNLRDITVCIDYSLSHVVIQVAGWREEYVFEVVV